MKRIKFLIIILLLMAWFPGLTAGDVPAPHESWDKLLKKHVENGEVDYRGFAGDIKQLDNYLEILGSIDISAFSREQKLAFWINAYNAFTVKLILNFYPVKSIRKISRPWKRRIWKTAGETLSLDDIEHKKLRKELKEPRIHFAIVCASTGCPDMQPFAFYGQQLDRQLDLAARHFFSSPKHFYFKMSGTAAALFVSKIFKWFASDFGKNKKERIDFISHFLEKADAEKIRTATSFKMKYLRYDWNLNEK